MPRLVKIKNFLEKYFHRAVTELSRPAIIEFLRSNRLRFLANRIQLIVHRLDFKNRRNFNRVNLSLNIITENPNGDVILRFRTLCEKDIKQIFHNPISVNMVRVAALKTTEDRPFLDINHDDLWHISTDVLNWISEINSSGYVYRDILGCGQVHTENYIFGLTCEKGEGVGFKKIRIMIIKESNLANEYLMNRLKYENMYQGARTLTIRNMHEIYMRTLKEIRLTTQRNWIGPLRRVEICVPKYLI